MNRNSQAAQKASRKLAVSLVDSTELRIILGVLYVMIEVLRDHPDPSLKENFKAELSKSCELDNRRTITINQVFFPRFTHGRRSLRNSTLDHGDPILFGHSSTFPYEEGAFIAMESAPHLFRWNGCIARVKRHLSEECWAKTDHRRHIDSVKTYESRFAACQCS